MGRCSASHLTVVWQVFTTSGEIARHDATDAPVFLGRAAANCRARSRSSIRHGQKPSKTSNEKTSGDDGAPQQPYVVLARKYRPETFDDLIGQEAMVTTLRNAFASDRIAQGYMLTGVRGVGKTTTARILARALNYSGPDIADKPTVDLAGYGAHCEEIIQSRHPDVIEMDAASNTGVDNIREIIESARYRPLVARYKVYIIDEVHMLSKGAFNALLKTLEEPPEHVKFIFATTEVRKVPVTVLSRCQRFDLRRVDVPQLITHFAKICANENATADDDALRLIARAAEGSVRDGLSILDQAIAMGSGEVGVETVRRNARPCRPRSHIRSLAGVACWRYRFGIGPVRGAAQRWRRSTAGAGRSGRRRPCHNPRQGGRFRCASGYHVGGGKATGR